MARPRRRCARAGAPAARPSGADLDRGRRPADAENGRRRRRRCVHPRRNSRGEHHEVDRGDPRRRGRRRVQTSCPRPPPTRSACAVGTPRSSRNCSRCSGRRPRASTTSACTRSRTRQRRTTPSAASWRGAGGGRRGTVRGHAGVPGRGACGSTTRTPLTVTDGMPGGVAGDCSAAAPLRCGTRSRCDRGAGAAPARSAFRDHAA